MLDPAEIVLLNSAALAVTASIGYYTWQHIAALL